MHTPSLLSLSCALSLIAAIGAKDPARALARTAA